MVSVGGDGQSTRAMKERSWKREPLWARDKPGVREIPRVHS